MKPLLILTASLFPSFVAGAVQLQTTEVAPVVFEKRGNVLFADFGKDAYGNLQIDFSAALPDGVVKVRLGEKLAEDGAIDRKPPGSVSFREVSFLTKPGRRHYRLAIPLTPRQRLPVAVKMPSTIGNVTPFRYAEIEGAALPLEKSGIRQLFVHAPFQDRASEFESSDATLNAVWALCKHTIKATTAFGIYIDGERERTPYEGDTYINLLSHYACDLNPTLARITFRHLLVHPTWPTEWSLQMPMIAAADYELTGNDLIAASNYEALKKKMLQNRARGDGLLKVTAIVDWPEAERDGYNDGKLATDVVNQVGPDINTVANAFYYHSLQKMAVLAHALRREGEARDWEACAKQVYEAFNRVFFDETRGIYVDGEGSSHASLHANLFPLAFGLVPRARMDIVADFVQSRGMACSVYGAQYLLEALFAAGRAEAAIHLMTAKTKRSWWHMIELGSTMTTEAWDVQFKKNLTWNHAWATAPANVLSRYVLGVRPIKPGFSEILVAPELGDLQWVQGRVPTPLGPVSLKAVNGESFKLEMSIPANARIEVPLRRAGEVVVDGKRVDPAPDADHAKAKLGLVGPGTHVIESR